MTEEELIQAFRRDHVPLQKLGQQIVSDILSRTTVGILVPPEPRVKSEESLLQKAFYRAKDYGNPYEDITDRVGVRFVTLTTKGLREVQTVVESLVQYRWSLDRDFEQERLDNPTTFIYQSVHYVLRPVSDLQVGGITIPARLPCEVQLRSILQHAYSELTHDTIYKPKSLADPETHRLAARSMALIETTDIIFCEALERFTRSSEEMNPMIQFILSKYALKVRFQQERKLNAAIMDAIESLCQGVTEDSIDDFITNNAFILERVRERGEQKLLYRQPSIILVYYLASTAPKSLSTSWPLPDRELDPVYSDLGISRDFR